jgi:extracellular factor (EF) 3-hydroxypalmitic acid methyl ester biosynthesis protein
MDKSNLIAKLRFFITRNGPSTEHFQEFTSLVDQLAELIKSDILSRQTLDEMRLMCGFLNDKESVMGHIYSKPYGYAGDFHIIDRIYTQSYSEKYIKWDQFALSSDAACAVRNRKAYFKDQILKKTGSVNTLLNVASGPCRDLKELFDENPGLHLKATCVDIDERAILYAKQINQQHLSKIAFVNANIFKYNTDEKFDLIWSAGLFDYFDDAGFIDLLKKFRSFLNKNGEIIIGNFNQEHNPSRPFMELFGNWYLNHRTEIQLLSLAEEAGFNSSKVFIGRESENINLFLHIRN